MFEKTIVFIRLFENFSLANIIFTNVEFINVEFINIVFTNVALDSFFVNSMIKTREMYNIQTQMRRNKSRFMTSMQELIHQLDDDDWTYVFQKNSRNQITHFFFSKRSSQSILKTNYKVLIINCIYKTNKYKMSLKIIRVETSLHKTFYVNFCFMTKEKLIDYVWILQ